MNTHRINHRSGFVSWEALIVLCALFMVGTLVWAVMFDFSRHS